MQYDPILENQPLIAEIERYCANAGITSTKFGVEAVNDGALVPDLKGGRELRPSTLHRIRQYMARPLQDSCEGRAAPR